MSSSTRARTIGASNTRIIVRHVLPNCFGLIVVNVTLVVAEAILVETTLSFLGFGIQPPTPSWGNLLSNSIGNVEDQWWLTVFPGLCIFFTVPRGELRGRRGARRGRPAASRAVRRDPMTANPILEIESLCVEFALDGGPLRVAEGVSFAIAPGERVALVGESGSGKTVTALAIMGLLEPPGRIVGGDIRLDGESLPARVPRRSTGAFSVAGDVAMVFQDPMSAFNPRTGVGAQVAEAITVHDRSVRRAAARTRAIRSSRRSASPTRHGVRATIRISSRAEPANGCSWRWRSPTRHDC